MLQKEKCKNPLQNKKPRLSLNNRNTEEKLQCYLESNSYYNVSQYEDIDTLYIEDNSSNNTYTETIKGSMVKARLGSSVFKL